MQAGSPRLDATRLADALAIPVSDLEATLSDVGVDADYLARALLEGDPQGAIASVARRLSLPRPEVIIALVKALAPDDATRPRDLAYILDAAARELARARGVSDVDAAFQELPTEGVVIKPEARARPPERPAARRAPDAAAEAAVAEFLAEKLPALARRLVLVLGLVGLMLLGLGGLGLAAPGLFQQVLLYMLAVLFVVAGIGLILAASRLRQVVQAVASIVKRRA